MPEYLFSNTSEKDMLYSCSTVCTHYNNIDLLLLCKFNYLIIFPTRFGYDFKFNPILYLFYIVLDQVASGRAPQPFDEYLQGSKRKFL